MTEKKSSGRNGRNSESERALYWKELMQEPSTIGGRLLRKCARWLFSSRENLYCLRSHLEMDAGLQAHQTERKKRGVTGDVQHWVEVARASADNNDLTWIGRLRRKYPLPRGRFIWPVTISFATLAIVAAVMLFVTPGTQEYSSKRERLRVVLMDNSVIDMDPHSVADVRITTEIRDIKLKNGGAQFEVASDPRPFNVNTSLGSASVRGTSFYMALVELYGMQEAVVNVRKGQVAVSAKAPSSEALTLVANQSARITSDGRLMLTASGAGRGVGQLTEFTDAPLMEVAKRFNERGHLPQFVIQGSACDVPVTGSLDIERPKSLLNLLAYHPDLKRFEYDGDERVLVRGARDREPTPAGTQYSDCVGRPAAAPDIKTDRSQAAATESRRGAEPSKGAVP